MARQRKAESLERMLTLRVSAILRTDDQGKAGQAMRAAVDGGFRMVEFTLTTPGALELIAEFSADESLVVGAGTVMTPDDVAAAVEAGARFIVSPICDAEVIAAARALDAVSIPGTYTPTEMLAAHRAGADMVKVFPAPADIAQYVRQIKGPMPYLRIFPTAGVTPDNFADILAAGAAGVGFVSSLFTSEDMKANNIEAIKHRAQGVAAALAATE